MRYTYRNTITGVEFESNDVVRGSNLIRLEPSASVERKAEPKAEEPKAEAKAPKKPVKRGSKK